MNLYSEFTIFILPFSIKFDKYWSWDRDNKSGINLFILIFINSLLSYIPQNIAKLFVNLTILPMGWRKLILTIQESLLNANLL
jgi:hypothetical protein